MQGLTIAGALAMVSEVTGADAAAIQAGLPALNPGWEYRTFREPGDLSSSDKVFMRVGVADVP